MNRVELPWLKVERSEGRSLSASPSETSPVLVSSSTVTVVIGTGALSVGRAMRVPVTTIAPSGSRGAASAGATSAGAASAGAASAGVQFSVWPSAHTGGAAGASWAKAGLARPTDSANADVDNTKVGLNRMVASLVMKILWGTPWRAEAQLEMPFC